MIDMVQAATLFTTGAGVSTTALVLGFGVERAVRA